MKPKTMDGWKLRTHFSPAWPATLLMLAVASAGLRADQPYLPAEMRIEGKEIHSFPHQGRTATVVLGPFTLKVDDRVITGRDAAFWVQEKLMGRTRLREVLLYAEGDVTVTEPDGASTRDSRMLIVIRHKGRFGVYGSWVDTPLREYPFFLRADKARQEYLDQDRQDSLRAISVVSRPQDEAPVPEMPSPQGGDAAPPEPLEPMEIVSARIGRLQTMTVDQETKRITIARSSQAGPVYLALGTQKGKDYLELRADAVVVFSELRPPREVRVPYGADTFGAASNLSGGGEGWQETITGIYLDGDVRIERGERSLTGPRAYYDMSTDRALIPNGVFRTIQEQRNIPVWITAKQVRTLSAREMWFKDAKVSTSDFHSPSYHIGAAEAYVKDTTPYGPEGEQLARESFEAELKHATFNVHGLPVLYWPWTKTQLQRDHTALRRLTFSSDPVRGFGVQSQWHLFRLLGMARPEGYKGLLDLDWTKRGPLARAQVRYNRRNYWGYAQIEGLKDQENEDEFGDDLENIPAPDSRGRLLIRHKQRLQKDWQIQFELSYLCDRNYLRQFAPLEYWAGKEQETLLYAKKTQDNWAFTALVKQRINRFQEQEEALPELTFWMLGQPLLEDRLSYYGENRISASRYRYANSDSRDDSDYFLRADSRHELTLPLSAGPVNITPYAVGRMSYWDDDLPSGGKNSRWMGQVGLRVGTYFWKVSPEIQSEFWNVDGLRHVIQPELTAFLGSTGDVQPKHLFPIDADVEQHIERLSGVAIGVHQRLQTRRGVGANRRTVDWMRFNVVAGFYDNNDDPLPSNGEFFWYRPENSRGRNHINADYTWHVSDSTTLLSDMNYDLDRDVVGQANVGLAISRSPRLRYYLGWSYIKDLDASVGTFAATYKINRKYDVTFTESYDFDYSGNRNLITSVSLVRHFPRWHFGFNIGWDARYDDLILSISAWPEGIPEVRLRGSSLSLLGTSADN